jgi:predicted RNA-binding protein with TRAM domain
MAKISDDLRLLFEAPIESEEGRYTISIPKELVENGSVSTDNSYRIALLAREADSSQTGVSNASIEDQEDTETYHPEPPVEVGDVRSVTVDTFGNQGDGLARVDRGFVVVVPDTQPGDQVDVKITEVRETVAFAKPISASTVR